MSAPAGSCALSIMAARPDLAFLPHTIPHLSRQAGPSITSRLLFLDTAPLGPKFRDRPNIGSLEDLRDCCARLIDDGHVDRVVDISYAKADTSTVLRRYFGKGVWETHNWRGYPTYGSIFSLERCGSEFVLHFDSDMLVHRAQDHDWVRRGMELIDSRDDVLFAAPLSGPPAADGGLRQRGVDYQLDPDGFYAFREWTSRKYLVRLERLHDLLPIRPMWLSWKRRLLSQITRRSALQNFEILVTRRMAEANLLRADLTSPKAWTLHTPEHGDEFLKKLPSIIERVEAGDFPDGQAGDYDLDLARW